MNKGHIFLAQNSEIDYIRQAYALALSIKKYNKFNSTCLVTNDEVSKKYKSVFDFIVPIPENDLAENSSWKIENRSKIIKASPFEENLVYDVDMLLLSTNDHWWNYLETRELVLTSTIFNYKKNVVLNDFYRKTFTANNLANVYTGCFYFKKCKISFEFFKWLEIIATNWKYFQETFLKKNPQKFFSLDVAAALSLKFMGIEDNVLNNSQCPSFIHMKPQLQEWTNVPNYWTDVLNVYFDSNDLIVGNTIQKGLFHYVENEFLTDDIISNLEE